MSHHLQHLDYCVGVYSNLIYLTGFCDLNNEYTGNDSLLMSGESYNMTHITYCSSVKASDPDLEHCFTY